MKKILSVILVFCMILNIAAFAVPVLDNAEPAVLAEESTAEKLTPGMNVFTGDTNSITFDTEADLEYVTVGPRWMANAVVDYEINSVSGRGNMLRFKNTNAVTDASEHFVVKLAFKADTVIDRPVYFIARVYDACTYWSGLGGGWMRQNASGNWSGGTISKILGEDSIPNSDTFQVEPWAIYSNNYWMCIDNVAVIPYYQITYKNILPDGTAGKDVVKYELDTENISVSSNDGVISGLPTNFTPACYIDEPEGYTLIGWSTDENASEAMATVPLANEDITLYPVWTDGEAETPVYVLKPGINAFTGNTTAVTFETEADLEYVSLAPVWDKTAVVDYQIGERTAYNGIGKSLMFKNTNGKTDASMHFVSRITATMPITVDRPAFMIARVGDAYTQWRCNGGLRTNTEGDWRKAEIKTILDGDNILNSDKLQIDALSLDGNSYWMYLDNLAVIPYYKVTYKNILPNGTSGEDVVKYELETSAISVSTNDGIIAGLPEVFVPSESLEADGYTFMGWTTEENGTSAMAGIPLENKDLVLYPVWYEGEFILPGTNGMWDFEMSDNYGWNAYGTGYEMSCEDGVLTVNTGANSIEGTPYISHNTVSLDTSKYRYLVLNVRNRSDADTFSFYYTTSTSPEFSEDKCFTINIEPDKGIFHDIVIDMKQFTSWQGYYQDCMLTLHTGGTGYVDFEEIYFTDDYYGDDGMYHYPLYTSAYTSSYPLVAVAPHKSTFNSYIRTWSTTAANDGYINFPAPTETLNTEDYAYFVIKSLRKDGNFDGRIVYYFTTSDNPSKSESKTVYASAEAGFSGFYNYHIFRLDNSSYYTGTLGGGMLKLWDGTGSMEIVDMFMCDSTDFLLNEIGVEQPEFRIDDTEISENGESINIKPYFSIPGVGVIENFAGAKWSVDSVCVTSEIDENGTLTLTGKMNGEVNVTVFFEYDDISYTDTAVITVSGQTPKLPATKIKLVTYGNSIMLHGPSESLGWYGNHGMAASSIDKDYVHQLIGNLEEKYGKGNVEHKYGSGQKSFESATSTSTTETDWETYLEGVTEFARAEQPDIVTVQYGENSTASNSAAYQYALTAFVDAVHKGAPDAVVLITLPWWSYKGLATYTGAENAAKALDVPLADLSALSQNREENWAIGKFEQYAVYSHPGDLGMERIADEMYTKMLPYLTTAIDGNIEYSAEITDVTVTADTNTITTPYGTLALTAKVEPSSANQSVSWKSSNENIATVDSNGVVTAINNGNVTITATSLYDFTVSGTIDLEISGQTPCYTLSFDKNTDDAVTNMPESNSYAKGETALPEIYPERKYFNFVGWALTADGTAIDSVNVEDDTVLYAVWEKAYRWSFDRDGFAEGFVIKNGFNQKIADGRYQSIATATDEASGNILTVVSPELDIAEGEFDKLVIKMQNTAINNGSSIRLEINADTSYNYVLPVASTEVAEYEFDLSEVKGTVTGFSFKPTNIDATVFLDEIYFAKNIYGKFYLESDVLGVSGASSMKINGESTEITEGKAYDVLLDKGLGTVSFNVNGKEKIFRITANENANGFVYTTDDKAFAAFTNGGYDGCTFIISTYKDRRISDTQILTSDDSLLCDITGMDKAVMFVFEDKDSVKPVCEEITVEAKAYSVLSGVYPAMGETVDTQSELVKGWLKFYSYGNILSYDKTGKSTETGVVLKWNSLGNPEKYVVTIGTNSDLADAKVYETTENSIRVDNLLVARDYYWQVNAVFEEGEELSDVMNFNTERTIRVMNMGGVGNVRDIGGYITEDGKYEVKQNMAFRGAFLEHINDEGLKLAKELGIAAELDLRKADEITTKNMLGVKYYNIPGIQYFAGVYHFANPENQEVIASEIRLFADESNYPIYFHCSGGRDRTGLVAMLVEGVIGVSEADIKKDFELTWMRGDDADYFGMFTALMNFVGQAGGNTFKEKCENYLLSIGITEDEIANIRSILLEEIK